MKKILIINANYYKDISKNLTLSAVKILKKKKWRVYTINVSGIFEIPIMLRKYIKKYDAFIALGCVIKGDTPHFDLISSSTFNAIMQISIEFKKPIGNGIITCLNLKQAKIRSSSLKNLKKPNKGIEAANAVVSVLENEPKLF